MDDVTKKAIATALEDMIVIYRKDQESDPRKTFHVLLDLLKALAGEETATAIEAKVKRESDWRY